MPRPLFKCEDCGSLVIVDRHRYTRRCLLNQVDRLRSYERPERGIAQRGNLVRDTLQRNTFLQFCRYVACAKRLWSNRPRGTVTAPFVPLNPAGANDVALMLSIINQNAADSEVVVTSGAGRRRLMAAALMTAVGFTTAFAVVVGIPPLVWDAAYQQRLSNMLFASHCDRLQVMNTGIQWQTGWSFCCLQKTVARRKIRQIVALLRALHASLMAVSDAWLDSNTRALRWKLALALEVGHVPTDGYTMSHGLQLANYLGCLSASGRTNAALPGEKICVRSGLAGGLAALFGFDIERVRAPAVARLLLETLTQLMPKSGSRVIFPDVYELGVIVCQWCKDEHADAVGVHDVFSRGLTSSGAAAAGNNFWTKRKLSELTDAALAEGLRLKRMRL